MRNMESTPEATMQTWFSAAAAVLRKSGRMTADDPDDRAAEILNSTTVEEVPVAALGTAALVEVLPTAGVPGEPPFLRGADQRGADQRGADQRGADHPDDAGHLDDAGADQEPHRGWDIRSYLADPDPRSAAEAVSTDLTGGANSLWLRVGGDGTDLDDLAEVLAGVHLNLAPVVLHPALDIPEDAAGAGFAAVLAARRLQPHSDSNLGADPIGRYLRSGPARVDARPDLEKSLRRTAVRALELGVKGFVVDGNVAHERGAGDAAELGYTLAVGVSYLRSVDGPDVDLKRSLSLFEFRYAATDDQFATIAKFRAARLLWDRVAELSGAGSERTGQVQHASTSRPMMTRYDSWTNVLRTTVAAFAAGVGGAQAITALAFDIALGVPDVLGRRLARNISHLLISESHVGAATDPAGGAAGVEALTWELANAAWSEFQRLEAGGGVVDAIADGSLRQRWDDTAVRRQERIATRRQAITGVSEFPLPAEVLPTRRPAVLAGEADVSVYRWAHSYELMRNDPAPAAVFLATIGSPAEYGARATFAANAFAAGGIALADPGPAEDVTGLLAGYVAAGSPAVVCLAGSDADYAELGKEIIRNLRNAGARFVIVAGTPTEDLGDLADDRVAPGDDVVKFLRRTRRALGVADTAGASSPSTERESA